MDIADFFRRGFQNLHKDLLDKNYRKKSLQGRKESLLNTRRQTRDTLMFNYRQIDANMSPLTPHVSTKKTEIPKIVENKNNSRLEKLRQWKEQKNKLKQEEKKKAKPIFKVFHVDNKIGMPDLERVNKEIKGKPIKPLHYSVSSFAPIRHKFRAPKHIEPVNWNKPITGKGQKTQMFADKKGPKYTKNVNEKIVPSTSGLNYTKNKNQSDNTKKILSRTNSNISIKRLPNAIAKNTKVLPKTISNIKKIAPNTTHNNSKKALPSVGANIVKKVSSTTNSLKKLPSSTNLNSKKDLSSTAFNKKYRVSSPKANKSVGWQITPTCKDAVEEKPGKKYQKTPRKPKKDAAYLVAESNTSLNSKITDSQVITLAEEENPDPVATFGKKSRVLPQIKIASTAFDECSNTSYSLEENTVNKDSIIIIDDSENDIKIEETAIIYDDAEITMKTPIKKRRTSSKIPQYTPRLTSARKSHGRKDSCLLCPDSPITDTMNKTPISKAKTPKSNSRRKSLKSEKEPVAFTPKSGKKSKKPNDEDTLKTPTSDIIPDSVKGTPMYISPFVTISRGKDSARKEYKVRKSTGGTFARAPDGRDFTDSTSPKAGAEYFEKRLQKEISIIEATCDVWDKYKAENDIAEETSDMIDVAVGQSKLLISKKFQQFRSLIDQCKSCNSTEKRVTCEDLHGFWDMIYQQVLDLNKRFDNLERLKRNNWQEILPEKKVVKKKRGRGKGAKKPTATSSLTEMIKAARNKKKQQQDVETLQPKTPENYNMRKSSPVRSSSSRRSLRVSLLRGPTLKRLSSPGLTMMKITQSIKAGDGLTPNKSILKTDLTKSAKRQTKSVLFVEDSLSKKVIFTPPEDKENNSKQANLNRSTNSLDDTPLSVRRSTRLNKA